VGTPTSSSRSSRPGRLRAGSNASRLFVAPITTTRSELSPFNFESWLRSSPAPTPSMSVSSVVSTRACAPPPPPPPAAAACALAPCAPPPLPPRAGASASTSSRNMTEGASARAAANTPCRPASLSPAHGRVSAHSGGVGGGAWREELEGAVGVVFGLGSIRAEAAEWVGAALFTVPHRIKEPAPPLAMDGPQPTRGRVPNAANNAPL
jgi:hypothetical protein